MKKWILIITSIILTNYAFSQVAVSDYQRADSMVHLCELVYNQILASGWVDSTDRLWYLCQAKKGKEFKIADVQVKRVKPYFDQEQFCLNLNKLLKTNYAPYNLPFREIKPARDLKSFEFSIKKKYKYYINTNKIEFIGELPPDEPYWGNEYDELSNGPIISPDSNFEAYINNYNVYIKDRKSGSSFQLSFDGSEGELYSSYIYWSPDSKKIITNKIRANKKRYLNLLESSPEDQFLPKTHQKEYLRPGDALPIKLPVLFNIIDRKQISLNTSAYQNQYWLGNLLWNIDGSNFTFEFNQRGHQVYQVLRVDANTGQINTVIDEHSNTFIDYSSKYYRYDLKNSKEIIWASERDGWNHLYLINSQTGEIMKQITKGNWVVREVVRVDEKQKKIYFSGSGFSENEDPYYIHYYSINFDGTDLLDLTPEKANHTAMFSADGKYFIDTYSTPVIPPVSIVYESNSGSKLFELERADISKLIEKGFAFPEPFVAKGRDGETNIWGNIYRPTDIDSTKKYPVIEYIYAGPQGSFVEKSFLAYLSPVSGLAELGFIIVQIDGMGTSDRSKAFHDVCYKNLKDAGFPDRVIWIKEAAKKYKYMDTTRIGIYGGSAGGQNTASALLFHPEFYKVGVASCGCHDNRLDKMWWNEQWMGYPIGPQYAECSNIDNAYKLQGHLMLIVGEIDDNVDPSSTYRFAKALITAKKDFELVLLPGANHTLGGEYGEHKRRDFFVRYLLGIEPPAWETDR